MVQILNFLVYTLPALSLTSNLVSSLADKSPALHDINLDLSDLLQLPEGWVGELLKSDENYPPIQLNTPTNVQVPSVERVKFHFQSTLKSYCSGTKSTYTNCQLLNCHTFKVLNKFDKLNEGGLVIIGAYEDTKEIIVAHRGSSNIQNWLSDFSFGFVNMNGLDPRIQVHNNFYKTYNNFANDVNSYLFTLLAKVEYAGYKVIITGHSLGGGTATIHAADQAEKIKATNHEVELLTYHSPRVGNRNFVDHIINLNIPISRYSNRGDIVSQVPFRRQGYVHIPAEVNLRQFSLSGTPKICNQSHDEDPECQWADHKTPNPLDHLNAFNQPAVPIC